jgi:hypothetical protein
VLGGSVTGRAHANRGTGCEDAHGWAVEPRLQRTCVAVADGAGSTAQAAIGAALATKIVVDALIDAPSVNERSVRAAFKAAHDALVDHARAERVDLVDLGTTLGVGVVSEHVLVVGQIGNTIAVAKRDGVCVPLSPAPQHEDADQTALLSGDDWESHLRVDVVSSVGYEGFALSTDGLRYKLLDDLATGTPHQPFFDNIFTFATEHPQAGDDLLSFLAKLDDRTDDDLTLVVAVPVRVTKQVRVNNTYRLHRPPQTVAPLSWDADL